MVDGSDGPQDHGTTNHGERRMELLKEFLEPLMTPIGMLGLLGQAMFFSRFLVQWLVSEKKGESTIPIVFWYLSLGGGVFLLMYALWRKDAVISIGQAVGLMVYIRNLVLIYRKRRQGGSS